MGKNQALFLVSEASEYRRGSKEKQTGGLEIILKSTVTMRATKIS
jgi:hypothetical protein